MRYPKHDDCTIAIIGLGYVGLPLAVEFAKRKKCLRTNKELNRKIIGFDINSKRIEDIQNGIDKTNEIKSSVLKNVKIEYTSQEADIYQSDVFIVTVPTPIDLNNNPDLKPLTNACCLIGNALKKRKGLKKDSSKLTTPIVIFESTVFPGAVEEVCVPIIEKHSGLLFNEDSTKGFVCGYSPERINPGDSLHNISNITKVTSGSNLYTGKWVDELYGSIINAGTHLAQSIKVAEAAKVIENTQRDLNIALINEFAIIFNKLNIDTLDILEAAQTKWNFLPFKPGLVGGHCIGVDPYYLTYKSQKVGYYPQLVHAARSINNSMINWITEQLILNISKLKKNISEIELLILGFTFKENCPDIRNTQVAKMNFELKKYGINPLIVDPIANAEECQRIYDVKIENKIPDARKFDVVIGAVPHKEFLKIQKSSLEKIIYENGFFYDIKGFLPRELNVIRL